MIKGQIIIYHYNGLHNSRVNVERNIHRLEEITCKTPEQFREHITTALDQVPPGKGYALVRWSGRTFICEKDSNNPKTPYVRHEIHYHPLMDQFTV
jgi:hypothetical protein